MVAFQIFDSGFGVLGRAETATNKKDRARNTTSPRSRVWVSISRRAASDVKCAW